MAQKKTQQPLLQDFPAHEQKAILAMTPIVELLHSMLPQFQGCKACGECWAYKVSVIDPVNGRPVTLCHAVTALHTTLKKLAITKS